MEGEHQHQTSANSSTQLVRRSVVVVTAGLSRRGKSTSLNNIFGTDFKSGYSPGSVTRAVEVRCVDGHKDELIVVDTPGLASREVKTSSVKKELDRAIGGLNFVLIYCHSVCPSNSISKEDEYVVKNLQSVLGKNIWKKCVLLFTFSDTLRHEECPKKEDRSTYKRNLDHHATIFSDLLQEQCGSHAPKVKVISLVESQQPTGTQPIEDFNHKIQDLLAIPVGKQLSVGREEHLLIPGVKINWRALAARMILEKAHDMDRDVYKSFFQDKVSLSTPLTGVILGAALGGAGGAVVGLAIGGFGIFPAAAIGAAAGAGAGLFMGGLAGGAGAKLLDEKNRIRKHQNKVSELRKAKHVERRSAPPNLDASYGDWCVISCPDGRRPRGISVPIKPQPDTSSLSFTSSKPLAASVSSGAPSLAPLPCRSPESPSPDHSLVCSSSTADKSEESIPSQRKAEEPINPEDPDS